MNMELTEKIIANKLFDFLEEHFDKFECKGSSFGWWWEKSWSPYIEACFIVWGKKLISEQKIDGIGHSFTYPNITYFMSSIGHGPYGKDNKFPDKNYDVSWHDSNELILALEHEETIGTYHPGPTVESNLRHISDEIDKLNSQDSKFKIIVSRPRLRKFQGKKDTYPDAIELYKEKIESILSKINASRTVKWIVVLMGPTNSLKPDGETDILFCSYLWNKKNQIPACAQKRLKVKMDENFKVKKV